MLWLLGTLSRCIQKHVEKQRVTLSADVVIAWIQVRNIDISTASTNNYAQE
jgi:hypothetical protein